LSWPPCPGPSAWTRGPTRPRAGLSLFRGKPCHPFLFHSVTEVWIASFFLGLGHLTPLVGTAAGAGPVGKNGLPAIRAGGNGWSRKALAGPALVPPGFGHSSLGQTHE
jgi:hypothetical protein